MLRKLMKYEFKATGRIFLPVFGALLLISILSRIFIELNMSVPQSLGIMLSVIMIIGLLVITFILTLQRFYKNLLEKEGYLMHTIPVKTESLIFSKLFTAAIWQALSVIVVVAAILILALSGVGIADVFRWIGKAITWTGATTPQIIIIIVELLLLTAATMFSSILSLYMCMSFGLLVNKHRGLASFGFYVALSFATQLLGTVASLIIGLTDIWRWFANLTVFGMTQVVFAAGFVVSLVLGVVYFLVTRLMLSKKLNLE